MAEISIYANADSLARAAAERFVTIAETAIATRGRFAVALAGGSTPRKLYALLASDEFASRANWPYVHFFWGDERCVPPDEPDSNYRMVRETLLNHIPIPVANVHRMRGEIDPNQAANSYESTLRDFFLEDTDPDTRKEMQLKKSFDLVLLGMGADGHTASLFPGTAAVLEEERWALAHYVSKQGFWRITLTPAIINAAVYVLFAVTGEDKAARLNQVIAGPFQPDLLPAQSIQPTYGKLLWLVDTAAASNLERAKS
jgi:6-phosphogluconolactonase